jgi:multidrug efflux pump subunit AcrA (membrane-fusion protein)
MADRLMQAEAELARLKAVSAPTAPASNVERMIPQVADRYRALVDTLEKSLAETDVDRARAELRALFGSINVVADEWEVRFEADLHRVRAALEQAAGRSANNVVAGAGNSLNLLFQAMDIAP